MNANSEWATGEAVVMVIMFPVTKLTPGEDCFGSCTWDQKPAVALQYQAKEIASCLKIQVVSRFGQTAEAEEALQDGRLDMRMNKAGSRRSGEKCLVRLSRSETRVG